VEQKGYESKREKKITKSLDFHDSNFGPRQLNLIR
jgi:hypothetical protein